MALAVVIAALGYLLDALLTLQGVSRAYMLLFTNAITGIVAGGLYYQLARHEKTQREAIRTRMRTIAEMNHHIRTVIVAPMTTMGQSYPSRVPCRFKGKDGWVVLDQVRTVDRGRLVKRLGRLDRRTSATVLDVLQEMFAP